MERKRRNLRVLVVDDEEDVRRVLLRILGSDGIQVQAVESGEAALGVLQHHRFDVILADVGLQGMDGHELLRRLRDEYEAQVVMMTGTADVDTTVRVFKGGAYGFLTKPFTREAVLSEIANAAEYGRLRTSTRSLPPVSTATALLGASPEIEEVRHLIARVAETSSTVLVLGESGTGKELVARSIHEKSRRRSQSFVTVNCAAIAGNLIESELFGHVRGAFTSAAGARAGLFETANGGTLLLDEIGDLAHSAQVKLLRVLQNGEIKAVGSDASKIVDVRVIAATNADLRTAMANGTFRQDLFYRLNVVTIRLPALRERPSDILLLARHFVERHAKLLGREPPALDAEAAQCLERYAWPGNVRELEHTVERAVVLSEGAMLRADALPSELRRTSEVTAKAALYETAGTTVRQEGVSMLDTVGALGLDQLSHADAKKKLLSEFTNAYVFSLLKATRGNVSEAARRAGVDRSNFRRLVRATSFSDPSWLRGEDDDSSADRTTPAQDDADG